jgi:hypothetical protein
MNDPVWSVNALIAIDLIGTGALIWWILNYDNFYNS